jgi:hypothetical protein
MQNNEPIPNAFQEQGKVTPNFDFDAYGIGAEDIKTELGNLTSTEGFTETTFPVDAFPLPIQQIIAATQETLNFPIDYTAASVLFAASVAIGNTHCVEVKNKFTQTAVLYLAIVGRAGTTKSHPLTFALQPIADSDAKSFRQYEQLKQEFDAASNLSKKEREEQGIGELVKPVWKKFLLIDFTPEALAEVHKFNKRGIGVYADELAGWFKNFNRYNSGSEMEFWLSQWSGKAINIDRKGGEPNYLPNPFISVGGTIQNGILEELAKNSRTQNGFIDRILFVILNNKKEPWSDSDLPQEIIDNWYRIIQNLLEMPLSFDAETQNPKPQVLRFTPEAKALLIAWQIKNTDACNAVESELLSGMYSKMDMYILRLALILELLQYACGESQKLAIGERAVEGAIKLAEYFKKSALKVHSILSNASPLDKFPTDKQNFYHELPDTFTTEQGLEIAKSVRFPERSFKRFLNQKELFSRVSRGEYEKLI